MKAKHNLFSGDDPEFPNLALLMECKVLLLKVGKGDVLITDGFNEAMEGALVFEPTRLEDLAIELIQLAWVAREAADRAPQE